MTEVDPTLTPTARNLVYNPSLGHQGGSQFTALPGADTAYVSGLEVWTANGPGDHEIISGIVVTWDNGESNTIGKRGDSGGKNTVFRSKERITKFTMYTGDWVDSMYYESTEQGGGWRAGGSGGSPTDLDIGDGRLVEFFGREGDDVDQLGVIFEGDVSK